MSLRHATSMVLFGLVAIATSGCAALDRVNDALYETGAFDLEPSRAKAVARDCAVAVIAGDREGRGVIVGPGTVLTVAHVVGAEHEAEVATSSFGWTSARVVRRIASSPEDLVELQVATEKPGFLSFTGFERERWARLGSGSPAYVIASSGLHGWARGLRHGDSGSPVIDDRGTVVGLVVGLASGGGGVLAPVRGACPRTQPIVVAQLANRR